MGIKIKIKLGSAPQNIIYRRSCNALRPIIFYLCFSLHSCNNHAEGFLMKNEEHGKIEQEACELVASLDKMYKKNKFNSFISNIENKNVLLLCGKTGSGKSTVANLLAGCELELKNDEFGDFPYYTVCGDILKNSGVLEISGSASSCTTIPGTVSIKDRDMVVIDCPGFGDTKGWVQEIQNSLCINKILGLAKSIKIALLVPKEVICGKWDPFIESIKATFSMFEESDSENHTIALKPGSLAIFITKIIRNPSTASLDAKMEHVKKCLIIERYEKSKKDLNFGDNTDSFEKIIMDPLNTKKGGNAPFALFYHSLQKDELKVIRDYMLSVIDNLKPLIIDECSLRGLSLSANALNNGIIVYNKIFDNMKTSFNDVYSSINCASLQLSKLCLSSIEKISIDKNDMQKKEKLKIEMQNDNTCNSKKLDDYVKGVTPIIADLKKILEPTSKICEFKFDKSKELIYEIERYRTLHLDWFDSITKHFTIFAKDKKEIQIFNKIPMTMKDWAANNSAELDLWNKNSPHLQFMGFWKDRCVKTDNLDYAFNVKSSSNTVNDIKKSLAKMNNMVEETIVIIKDTQHTIDTEKIKITEVSHTLHSTHLSVNKKFDKEVNENVIKEYLDTINKINDGSLRENLSHQLKVINDFTLNNECAPHKFLHFDDKFSKTLSGAPNAQQFIYSYSVDFDKEVANFKNYFINHENFVDNFKKDTYEALECIEILKASKVYTEDEFNEKISEANERVKGLNGNYEIFRENLKELGKSYINIKNILEDGYSCYRSCMKEGEAERILQQQRFSTNQEAQTQKIVTLIKDLYDSEDKVEAYYLERKMAKEKGDKEEKKHYDHKVVKHLKAAKDVLKDIINLQTQIGTHKDYMMVLRAKTKHIMSKDRYL